MKRKVSILMILVMLMPMLLFSEVHASATARIDKTSTSAVEGKTFSTKVTAKASSSRNVTNHILNMTAVKAGKKLRIPIFYGPTHRKKLLQTRIKVRYNKRNKKGEWELFVMDKRIAFYGCKVGMTKKQVAKLLKKSKWKWKRSEKETTWNGYTNVFYISTDKHSYAYKKKGILEVRFDEKGKVWMMHYGFYSYFAS